ncbi:MAG: DNA-binding protein [Oscillospiraceae bacterium]|nr:DNA-binding protein [Oscillospiraceae bacterium]
MQDKNLRLALLFDAYGALLTPRQQLIFDLYHNDDLSLGEIAENEGISRQAVSDCLEKARAALEAFEEKIGALKKQQLAESCAARLEQLAQDSAHRGELLEISNVLRGGTSGI